MKRIIIAAIISASSLAFGSVSSLKFQGQRISGSELSIYQEFQLKAGDVIISFDDQPLTSPTDAMELYKRLKSAKLSKLLIERDGHYEILSRSIN